MTHFERLLPRRTVWMLGIGCSLVVFACAASAEGQTPAAPEKILSRDFGLVRQGPSGVWITSQEQELRRRLDRLPRLVEQARAAYDTVLARIEVNQVLWARRQALEKAVKKKSKSQASPGDSQRKQFEQELQSLDLLAVAPDKLGGTPSVQAELARLTTLRNTIFLDAQAVRQDIAALNPAYTRLGENQEVQTALGRLGGEHRLGPVKNYEAEARRVSEYEEFAFALPQPLYLQSGELRLGAILDERLPVTFTWRDRQGPTVLTAGIAQAAGIEPDPNAPRKMIACPGGRRLSARRVTLSSLRFGRHVLRDVEAYVLPPEGEDCGATISPAAFAGYRIAAEPAQMRFVIEPEESE